MKKKNVLMMAMSLVLVAVIAVGGTLAYLTSNSGTLTNTFTVGEGYGTPEDPGFYLDETKKVGDTNPTKKGEGDANRLKAPGTNTYEPMSIGDTLYKDPTFHLVDGPDSYVFAKITGVDALKEKGFLFDTINADWMPVQVAEGKVDGYYCYKKTTVAAGTEMAPLFTTVTLNPALTEMPDMKSLDVDIVGVAIQAKNLTNWEAAWAALENDAPDFYPAA